MITEIECTYEAHFSFRTDDLDVEWERVIEWYIKYGNLFYTLDDGTEGEEALCVENAYDNLDVKWPSKIMVCRNGHWVNKGEEEE